jgi:hypothetical protein
MPPRPGRSGVKLLVRLPEKDMTADNEEPVWTWNDLTAAVPVIATSFAFAFNVGYFTAIDIGWFSIFSLQEHVVFALRAIPIAVVALVLFVIGLNLPPLMHSERSTRPGSWPFVLWWVSLSGFLVWIIVLLVAAYVSLKGFKLSFFFAFIVVLAGSFIHLFFRLEKCHL